ncbi:MAG TPA: hypothetical protein VEK08_13975, partial [Planctomycetota bacterium]|nr:hypothetical protein [Planctomycetota bacterium]
MRTLYFFMVGLISCPLFAAAPGAAPVPAGEDKPLRVAVVAQDAPGYYSAQLLGDMDRPVGNGIKMMGITIPARLDAKG